MEPDTNDPNLLVEDEVLEPTTLQDLLDDDDLTDFLDNVGCWE